MTPQERIREGVLESIMAKHAAFERKTLADLERHGMHFENIHTAYRRLKAQRTVARLNHEQVVEAIEASERMK